MFDKAQAKLTNALENFGKEDMKGLFALIPQNIRQATAGLAKSLSDPLNKAADKLQENVNQALKQPKA